MLTLRFEDFEVKNGQNLYCIMQAKKNQKKRFTISEEQPSNDV